jgi:stringent starvation protein B
MADGPRNLPSKKDVVLALLQGPSVFVHLDPRKKGVVVPPKLRSQAQLVLQIGLNMAVSIPDLRVDDEGVSCTLSFSRSPFWCALPWSAIYALVSEDGPGMVWPDDVPPEVAAQMQAAVAKQTPKRPRPKLAAVGPRPAEEAGEPASASESDEAASAPDAAPAGPRPAPGPRPVESAEPGRAGAEVVPIRPLRKEPEPPPAIAEAEDTPRPVPRAVPGKKPRRELPPYLKVIK